MDYNLPGENNAFISSDIQEKYNKLLDQKINEISNKFHYMRISSINDIMLIGFQLGIDMCVELITESEFKEKYL